MTEMQILNDVVFYEMFGRNSRIEFTEYLVECLLCRKPKSLKGKLILNGEEKIEKTKIKDKSFTTDIMVEILEENLILNIEAYTSFSNRAFLKSLSYINRIFSTQLDIGEEYEKLKQCRQINIVDKVEINLEKSPIFVNFFASFKEILTKKESIEFIRLDTI